MSSRVLGIIVSHNKTEITSMSALKYIRKVSRILHKMVSRYKMEFLRPLNSIPKLRR
jgi:hypothetical protein